MPRRLLALVALTVIALAATLGAAADTVPANAVLLDTAVAATAFDLELYGAALRITFDPEAASTLRVVTLPAADGSAGVVEYREEGARGTLVRTDAATARLRVDLVVAPATALTLSGIDLQVAIEGALKEPGADGDADAGGAADAAPAAAAEEPSELAEDAAADAAKAGKIAVHVEDSEVSVWQVSQLVLQGRNSSLFLADSRGRAAVKMIEGTVEIERHRGPLELTGVDSDLTVGDVAGALKLAWEGGAANLQDGRGTVQGNVSDALLRLAGWHGGVALTARDATLDLRGTSGAENRLDVRGDNVEATVEDWRGTFNATLTGGGLTGSGWQGKSTVSGRNGTRVTARDLHGTVGVWLYGDSTGSITNLAGQLQAEVSASRLTVDGARQLSLSATDANVTVRRVERLGKLNVQRCELDLDLSAIDTRRPVIAVESGTRMRLQMPSPCLVEVDGAFNQVSVSGCEVKDKNVGKRQNAPRSVDGDRMMRLTLKVLGDAEVDVEGRS